MLFSLSIAFSFFSAAGGQIVPMLLRSSSGLGTETLLFRITDPNALGILLFAAVLSNVFDTTVHVILEAANCTNYLKSNN